MDLVHFDLFVNHVDGYVKCSTRLSLKFKYKVMFDVGIRKHSNEIDDFFIFSIDESIS